MKGIGGQVHDHLVNLGGIGNHHAAFWIDALLEFNRRRKGGTQQFKHLFEDRRALDDLHREEPGLHRVGAREGDLAGDVGADLGLGIALRRYVLQGLQPHLQGPAQDRAVERLLAAEVVEQVGLGHAGGGGDLVDRRALEAVAREDAEGGFQDLLLVDRLDAGALAGLGRARRPIAHALPISSETPRILTPSFWPLTIIFDQMDK